MVGGKEEKEDGLDMRGDEEKKKSKERRKEKKRRGFDCN